MLRSRLAAFAALVFGVIGLAILVALVIEHPWRGVVALALLALALAAAWHGLRRRGAPRVLGLGVGALLLAGFVAVLFTRDPLWVLGLLAALAVSVSASRYAFVARVARTRAPRPQQPVLLYNPRSGGGKAARYHLAEEAASRGIRAIELRPGTNLADLVREALDSGADALAMAGGDGSQAIVAALATERGVPYACIPAGTRNHFALDLGVDREDVIGALDAFTDGGERLVDIGEVNGRTFVNNVSLGVYGRAVQQPGYRNAKLRTLLDTVPEVHGPGVTADLRWRGPDGLSGSGGAGILVSNNRYRLGPVLGAGTRPSLDQGVLSVVVINKRGEDKPFHAWTTSSFEIDADGPVPVGIDGEAVVLDPPLRFRIRPAALRCRIARRHPGASPSALEPERAWAAIRALAGIAVGHDPRPVPGAARGLISPAAP
jgi:diacylglycerol kinase family enzyme